MGRVVMVAVGTRGDVVPYAALGAALQADGQRVTILTHPSLRAHVDEAGLDFAALPVEITGPLTSARLARLLAARWLEVGRSIVAAAQDADLLVLSAMGWLGYHVAEAAGIPSIGAFLQPLDPTRAFPPPLLTTHSLGGRGNVTAARWFRLAGQIPFARGTADLRRELGLAPLSPAATFRRMTDEQWPALYSFSPAVVPPPADWPAHRAVTGYWWPRTEGALSVDLQRFLDDGEPPVFVGFGSMDPWGVAGTVDAAVAASGRRAVVQRAILGAPTRVGDVLYVGPEPHTEVFGRVAVVVHHAGAGTTAAALRAGTPAVCVPFTADQPFWAQRVAALGAGPAPVDRGRLTAHRLADAIDRASAYRPGAEAVAARLAGEDGLSRAVGEILRMLADR